MMAEQMGKKEIVDLQELLMAQMIQLDAVSELLIEKGIITSEEFVTKLKQVQSQYEARRAVKG